MDRCVDRDCQQDREGIGRERIWNALIFQGFDACCAVLSDLKSATEPHLNITALSEKVEIPVRKFELPGSSAFRKG